MNVGGSVKTHFSGLKNLKGQVILMSLCMCKSLWNTLLLLCVCYLFHTLIIDQGHKNSSWVIIMGPLLDFHQTLYWALCFQKQMTYCVCVYFGSVYKLIKYHPCCFAESDRRGIVNTISLWLQWTVKLFTQFKMHVSKTLLNEQSGFWLEATRWAQVQYEQNVFCVKCS